MGCVCFSGFCITHILLLGFVRINAFCFAVCLCSGLIICIQTRFVSARICKRFHMLGIAFNGLMLALAFRTRPCDTFTTVDDLDACCGAGAKGAARAARRRGGQKGVVRVGRGSAAAASPWRLCSPEK